MADLKNIEEIRGRDTRELRLELQEHRKELFQLRFHGAAESVAKSSRHREIRRTVARILTIIGERERGAEVVPALPGAAAEPAKAQKPASKAKAKAQSAPAAKPAKASKPAKAKTTKATKPDEGKASKKSGKQ
jgi:large subunit ribosomal protein L29